MAKSWYILHTYSGYENKIEKTIKQYVERGELSPEIVLDVKVPVETVEIRDGNGKKKTVSRKFLNSYIMIALDLSPLNWKDTCTKIRRIQGVTGFVGTVDTKSPPRPISDEEAKSILQKTGEIKGEKITQQKQSFDIGEKIQIIGGPFATFQGTIEEVNIEKSKLRVMVGIFGRNTPVEVDMSQVEKV